MTSLRLAEVQTTGDYPPVYVDAIQRRTTKDREGPLPQRAIAITSLRHGDLLVVHDAAALGLTEGDIVNAMAAIGQRGATLVVCYPEAAEYRWHPDAAEIAGLAADGGKVLAREKARVRAGSSPNMGRPKKLAGEALKVAKQAWGDRSMNVREVADHIRLQTGVVVSTRTLHAQLGTKTDAVAAAERKLR